MIDQIEFDLLSCPNVKNIANLKYGKKTLILDRDGTINRDDGYVYKIRDFAFTLEFLTLSKALSRFDGNICIVTNQGGVALGKFAKSDSVKFTDHVVTQLANLEINISMTLACFHHDIDECDYRKPNLGMVNFIMDKLGDLNSNYLFLGNDFRDRELSRRLQIKYLDIKEVNLSEKLLDWTESN